MKLGERFAFACWVRLCIAKYEWCSRAHGWRCSMCQESWQRLKGRV